MSHTRSGIPLWLYYQQKTPITNLVNVQENNIYFMMEDGLYCKVVSILKKDMEKNTITVQYINDKSEKNFNLKLFEKGALRFYENEIDP